MAYNDDQERDENGQWTSGGGGGSASGKGKSGWYARPTGRDGDSAGARPGRAPSAQESSGSSGDAAGKQDLSESKGGSYGAAIGKALKLPGGDNASSKADGSYEWTKKGGYQGQQAVERVRQEAQAQGWRKQSAHEAGSPDGGVSSYRIEMIHDAHPGWKLSTTVSFGQVAADNRYSIRLKKTS